MRETGNRASFDTAKTVLIPVDVYEEGLEEDYLRFGGMALAEGEVAIASEPREGIVAVMGIGADKWKPIKREYKRGEVRVTSPLLSVASGVASAGSGKSGKREINILLGPDNVYIAVREKGLKVAEVLPDNSTGSLLYYMQVLGRGFKLKKFDINIGGEKARKAADALKPYFGKIRIVEWA